MWIAQHIDALFETARAGLPKVPPPEPVEAVFEGDAQSEATIASAGTYTDAEERQRVKELDDELAIARARVTELVLQLAAWGYLREGSGCRFGERFEFTCDVSPVVFRRV